MYLTTHVVLACSHGSINKSIPIETKMENTIKCPVLCHVIILFHYRHKYNLMKIYLLFLSLIWKNIKSAEKNVPYKCYILGPQLHKPLFIVGDPALNYNAEVGKVEVLPTFKILWLCARDISL